MAKHVAWYENPYFLQDDHYTCTTMFVDGANSLLVQDDEGRNMLPAGTIWPANNNTAMGIVFRDTLVPAEGATFSMLTHGRINPDYLPAAPAAAALTALPSTIQFSKPGVSNPGVPAGYFQIKTNTLGSLSAGMVDATALEAVSIKVDRVSPSAFAATASQNVLDWHISNGKYPVSVKSVSVASNVATLVLTCERPFHAHAGDEITLVCHEGCFSSSENYPSNSITILKFV